MRIRNFWVRFSGVFGAVVRDWCPNRARLGGSRRRAVFSRLAACGFADQRASVSRTRVDSRSRKREFFDNLTRMQPGATPRNAVQPGATWCDRNHDCAKRTHFTKSEQSPGLRCAAPSGRGAPGSRDVAKCQEMSGWVGNAQNEPISPETLLSCVDTSPCATTPRKKPRCDVPKCSMTSYRLTHG